MKCPPRIVLQQVLAGVDAAPWTEHISHCSACQQFLDATTDDPDLRSWSKYGISQQTEPGLERFLAKVRGQPHAWYYESTNADDRSASALLAKPTRPNDLGTLGPYHIEKELGRGGMGVVFRAFDPSLQRSVAIKVLRPAADDADTRTRLHREARALAQLDHSHIVGIHAIAETSTGLSYLVTEFVNGPNLADFLRHNRSLSAKIAAAMIADIADALQIAHQAGMIHRDVKPANILLAGENTQHAKLTDFGLVRGQQSTATATGILAGTPAYMSPEQIREPASVDARTDVYSLGATLYECLTGDVPFRGSSAMVLKQVMDDEPRPPRRLNESVPRDLEVICLKALTKERHRRYASSADFAADLRSFINGQPISARPVSVTERMIRWGRRNPLPAFLTIALLVVFALGLAGVIWQWRVAVAESLEANDQRRNAEENLRAAADVVDQFLTRVSEDKLRDIPGFEPLRRELLDDALKYYESFLAKPAATDELRVQSAKAATRAAQVINLLRPPAEMIAAWDRAIAAWEKCADAAEHRDEWLSCQLNRAIALTRADRLPEAQQSFETLLPEVQARAANHPRRISYQRDLASVGAALANIHCVASNTEPALAMFATARQAFEKMLRDDPDNVDILRRLGFCLNNSAMLLTAEKALPMYNDALQTMQRTVARPKPARADQFLLARIHHHRGVALADLKRHDEARTAMASACHLLQQLVDGSPDVTDYRKSLAGALHWLGAAQVEAKSPEAADTLQRARREWEKLLTIEPNSRAFQESLASVKIYQQKLRLDTKAASIKQPQP